MTDRKQIIGEVEALLGSGGTRELAESLFDVLRVKGFVLFDAQDGFSLAIPESADRGQTWCSLLQEAEEAIEDARIDEEEPNL